MKHRRAVKMAALSALIAAFGANAAAAGNRAVLGRLSAPAIPTSINALPALPAAFVAGVSPAQPAAPLAALSERLAPQLGAVADPGVSETATAQAGGDIAMILQGGQASDRGLYSAGSSLPGRPPSLPSPAPSATPAKAPPSAPGPAQPRQIRGSLSYETRRLGLSMIADIFGLVYSLPQAGPGLTAKIVRQAARKDAVFADFDDTLGAHRGLVSAEVGQAMVAVMKAGKQMAVITDRPSLEVDPNDTSALYSLSSIPAEQRAGLILATKKDGYILRYDEKGEAQVLWREPPFSEAQRQALGEAAEATAALLPKLGTQLKYADPGSFTYALILQEGTPAPVVVAVAKALQAELAARGLSYEVVPRLAKDPAKPPYVVLAKIDKSWATQKISELTGITADRALIIGDSMYAPQDRKTGRLGRLARHLGERLSGRPLPLTGNDVDREMEKGLPGALTLGVGGTADPRMLSAYVLDGKGPEATLPVLVAVSSRPPTAPRGGWKVFGQTLAVLGFLAASLLAAYLVLSAFALMTMQAESEMHQAHQHEDWLSNP